MARRRSKPTTEIATPSRDDGGGMARPASDPLDLAAINEEARRIWRKSLFKQQHVRRMLRHEMQAPLPKELTEDGAAAYFGVDGERKYKRSRDVINTYAKRWPVLARDHPMGTGPAINSIKIEQGLTGVMRSDQRGVAFPKDAVIDNLVNEGYAAVITQPAMSYWQVLPTTMRLNGEILPEYRRDAKGRSQDDEYYTEHKRRKFAVDKDESRKAFDRKVDWLKSRHIPILQRSISIEQGLPFLGSTGNLEAFIVASQYAVPQLRRDRLAYWDKDRAIMMGAGGAPGFGVSGHEGASSQMKTVYEYWSYGCECDKPACATEHADHPTVRYQVEKCETYSLRDDGTHGPAFICFGCEYGMRRLPIAWSPGLGWPGSADPDDWGEPLPWTYLRNDLVQDQVATGLCVAFWRVGYPTFHAKPDQIAASLPENDVDRDEPDDLVIKPLTLIRSNDTITQIAGASPSDGGMKMLAYLDAGSEREAPDVTGAGGGDAAIAQTTAAKFGRDEIAHIENAYLSIFGQAASHVGEVACGIAERPVPGMQGRKVGPIAITSVADSAVATYTERDRKGSEVLTLKPEWFGNPPIYAIKAEMPIKPGDNLALTQQLADLHDRAIVDMAFVLEQGLGITDPENMIMKVEAEKIRNEPAGRALILARMAKLSGDRDEAEMQSLKALQILSQDLGLPNALGALPPASPEAQAAMMMQQQAGIGPGMDPNAGPDPMQGGGLTGMAMPNVAASQLGGAVAGAMGGASQVNAAAMGVPIPMGG